MYLLCLSTVMNSANYLLMSWKHCFYQYAFLNFYELSYTLTRLLLLLHVVDSVSKFIICHTWIKNNFFFELDLFKMQNPMHTGREIFTAAGSYPRWPKWHRRGQAEAGSYPGAPCGSKGPRIQALFCCFLWHISRKLDWKSCHWDLNPHMYGMLALQGAA